MSHPKYQCSAIVFVCCEWLREMFCTFSFSSTACSSTARKKHMLNHHFPWTCICIHIHTWHTNIYCTVHTVIHIQYISITIYTCRDALTTTSKSFLMPSVRNDWNTAPFTSMVCLPSFIGTMMKGTAREDMGSNSTEVRYLRFLVAALHTSLVSFSSSLT